MKRGKGAREEKVGAEEGREKVEREEGREAKSERETTKEGEGGATLRISLETVINITKNWGTTCT